MTLGVQTWQCKVGAEARLPLTGTGGGMDTLGTSAVSLATVPGPLLSHSTLPARGRSFPLHCTAHTGESPEVSNWLSGGLIQFDFRKPGLLGSCSQTLAHAFFGRNYGY